MANRKSSDGNSKSDGKMRLQEVEISVDGAMVVYEVVATNNVHARAILGTHLGSKLGQSPRIKVFDTRKKMEGPARVLGVKP